MHHRRVYLLLMLICLAGINVSTTPLPPLNSIKDAMLQASSRLEAIQLASSDSTIRAIAYNYETLLWMTMGTDDASLGSVINHQLQHEHLLDLAVPYLCALMSGDADLAQQLEAYMDESTIRLVRKHAQILNA